MNSIYRFSSPQRCVFSFFSAASSAQTPQVRQAVVLILAALVQPNSLQSGKTLSSRSNRRSNNSLQTDELENGSTSQLQAHGVLDNDANLPSDLFRFKSLSGCISTLRASRNLKSISHA